MPSHMTYNVQKVYKAFGKETDLKIQTYDLSKEQSKSKDLWSIRYPKNEDYTE